MNKSLLTNLIAGLLTAAGFVLPAPFASYALMTGLFALSGALTNWLAVHMLFERVPGLYGSGVIPRRFEEFRAALHNLIMEKFFTEEQIDKALTEEAGMLEKLDEDAFRRALDLDALFDDFVRTILESQFGGMVKMLGGASALEALREPFKQKMGGKISHLVQYAKQFLASADQKAQMREKIDGMVSARLEEMTPALVKQIVQDMIREHLGWLVVWGGVFGGIFGLATALISQ